MLGYCDVFIRFSAACGLALTLLVPSTPAFAAHFEVLHRFKGGRDGKYPIGVMVDKTGNLYGSTDGVGGSSPGKSCSKNCGGTYEIVQGHESPIFAFDGKDGSVPSRLLELNGALYGTTEQGGAGESCYPSGGPVAGCGVIFSLTPNGTEEVLYTFCSQPNCTDGGFPGNAYYAFDLIADRSSNLYGVTENGGSANCGFGGNIGCGTVFRLAPDGTYTVLYTFCPNGAPCTDGEEVSSGLTADSAGNLYGVTYAGGAGTGCYYGASQECGTVFELAFNGSSYTEMVLYSFCSQSNCTDGTNPSGNLIVDKLGNLYGTTIGGGPTGRGAVFKLTPGGNESVLYSFCSQANCADGVNPMDGVIEDKLGNLYGMASGGIHEPNCYQPTGGCGVIFRLSPSGTETVLHTFCSEKYCNDGGQPLGGLQLAGGSVFGTASIGGIGGGTFGNGTVYEVVTR